MKKSMTKYILIGGLVLAIAGSTIYVNGSNLQGKFSTKIPSAVIAITSADCKGTLNYTSTGGDTGDLDFDALSSLVKRDIGTSGVSCKYTITLMDANSESISNYKTKGGASDSYAANNIDSTGLMNFINTTTVTSSASIDPALKVGSAKMSLSSESYVDSGVMENVTVEVSI